MLPHVRFNHDVLDATWNEDAQVWEIETSAGGLTANMVVAGMGPLSEPRLPEIPGIESFEGTAFHSAEWNHDYDLTGKRVAVVGTGASAVQLLPRIQPKVASLHLFQRTPAWVMPHSDRPITRIERRLYRRFPALQRFVRGFVYWSHELLVFGMVRNPKLMRFPQRIAMRHLESGHARGKIVISTV